MKLSEGQAVMYDRQDGDPAPGTPSHTIRVMHKGEQICIAVWPSEWANIFPGEVVSWDAVMECPKLYGMTEKQARDAAALDVEF